MTTRRDFIIKSALAAGSLVGYSSIRIPEPAGSDITLSLAEWSFNRALYSGKMDHLDFPSVDV